MAVANQLPIDDVLTMLRRPAEQLVEASPAGWGMTPLRDITEVRNVLLNEKDNFPNIRVAVDPINFQHERIGQRTGSSTGNRAIRMEYRISLILTVERDKSQAFTGVNGGLAIGNARLAMQLIHDVDDIFVRLWDTDLVNADTKSARSALIDRIPIESPFQETTNRWVARVVYILPKLHVWTV